MPRNKLSSGDPIRNSREYARGLFERLEEFFVRATGSTASKFASVETFVDVMKANATAIAPKGLSAFQWLDSELRSFQATRGADAFGDAKQLGGMKLVLGGGSRFLETQLEAVSTAVLYSDTVMIPDPVMPWLETERREERFPHVHVMQAVHALLQLKPLVDADLPVPPIVVFPSWEKLLEENDSQTQEGVLGLVAEVIASVIQEPVTTFQQVIEFADRHPERFLERVDGGRLFVAPGGEIGESLSEALARYEREMATWRSREWMDTYQRIPQHRRVLNGIAERVGPVYHWLENAEELVADPLMCLEVHAHYFRLASSAGNAHLQAEGALDQRTLAMINGLSDQRLRWLGRLPVEALVNLRRDQQNGPFRQRLAEAVARLHDAELADLNRVAAEVCHELEIAIAEHEREVRDISERYNRLHEQTAVLAFATLTAALIPALAPLVGGSAIALGAKYGYDKASELADRRKQSRSVVGVLAAARAGESTT